VAPVEPVGRSVELQAVGIGKTTVWRAGLQFARELGLRSRAELAARYGALTSWRRR
jgi:hypothetical protein